MFLWLLFSTFVVLASSASHQDLQKNVADEATKYLEQLSVSLEDLLPEDELPIVMEQDYRRPMALFTLESEDTTDEIYHAAHEVFLAALQHLFQHKITGIDGRKAGKELLQDAARLGSKNAKKLMAFHYLFEGDTAKFDEMTQLLKELAVGGSADGQLGMGFLHATGLVPEVGQDQAKAITYYTFAAEGGSPMAQMAVGYRHYHGVGVEKSCPKALGYYRQAAGAVVDGLKFNSAPVDSKPRLTDDMDPDVRQLTTTGTDQNEIEYAKLNAQNDDPQLTAALGYLYLTGRRGVEQNLQEAKRFLEKAVNQRDASAAAHLGTMYLEGTPVTPANNWTAFANFYAAAREGSPLGMTGLGHMYLFGLGVLKDRRKAVQLFIYAAKMHEPVGNLYLGYAYETSDLSNNIEGAVKYYQRAAEAGQVMAIYNLARLHFEGNGVRQSCDIATQLYRQTAERGEWNEMFLDAAQQYKNGDFIKAGMQYLFLAEMGFEVAQVNMAHIFEQHPDFLNSTVAQSHALGWWRRAAEQNVVYARNKLGDYYYYGMVVPEDHTTAFEHYQIAAERFKSSQALFNLGQMHEQGDGAVKDWNMARTYYDLALQHNPKAWWPVHMAVVKMNVARWLAAIRLFQYLDATFTYWDVLLAGSIIGALLFLNPFRRFFTAPQV